MGFLWAAVLAAILVMASPARASISDVDYSGHYELVDVKADRVFSLNVTQARHRANVTFSAAMADGSGPAPAGAGEGRIRDGVLSFKFKDSFNNEGTCTLQPGKGGYQLSMTVTKVVEPRPLHFYGNVLLKKVSDRP